MSVTTAIPTGQPFDLARQRVGLERETGTAVFMQPRPGPPARIPGYTVGVNEITGDSPHDGEMHPDADELLYLISGAVKVLLELPGGHQTVDVAAGQALVVPRGTWHQIYMVEPGQLLNITPGPSGEYRPRS